VAAQKSLSTEIDAERRSDPGRKVWAPILKWKNKQVFEKKKRKKMRYRGGKGGKRSASGGKKSDEAHRDIFFGVGAAGGGKKKGTEEGGKMPLLRQTVREPFPNELRSTPKGRGRGGHDVDVGKKRSFAKKGVLSSHLIHNLLLKERGGRIRNGEGNDSGGCQIAGNRVFGRRQRGRARRFSASLREDDRDSGRKGSTQDGCRKSSSPHVLSAAFAGGAARSARLRGGGGDLRARRED